MLCTGCVHLVQYRDYHRAATTISTVNRISHTSAYPPSTFSGMSLGLELCNCEVMVWAAFMAGLEGGRGDQWAWIKGMP